VLKTNGRARSYFVEVGRLLADLEVTDAGGRVLSLDEGVDGVLARVREVGERGKKVVLVGNGGSAAIAGHMEMDLCNRVGGRAHVFNDPPVLTALSNDHGFEVAFERMVKLWAEPGDCLIAISSSGQSANILSAARAARAAGCAVVTFSGFASDNPLRSLGDYNFYVAARHYGHVEVAHHVLGHFLTDTAAEAGDGGEPRP
jgi:D-sedoheptulose 7-phosphate isomerase